MGTSHGATFWPCKAPDDEADLVRLPGARRAVHRDLVGVLEVVCGLACATRDPGPLCRFGVSVCLLRPVRFRCPPALLVSVSRPGPVGCDLRKVAPPSEIEL